MKAPGSTSREVLVMRRTRLRNAAAVCGGWLVLLGTPPVYPQQTSFVTTDSGFSVTVTGIEGVEAIASATPGVVAGAAAVTQTLDGNRLTEGFFIRRSSVIQNSFRDNQGIVMLNQESGNLNNQANVRVLALVEAGAPVQDLGLVGAARRTDNTVIISGGERKDQITNSFGGAGGIVGANQSAGNLNQQANVLVLGIGVGPEVLALGEATLGEVSANNTLKQGLVGSRAEIITEAFGSFRGIAQVSQSSGDLNVIRNFLGVSVTVVDLR